jgi:hypothetical protein
MNSFLRINNKKTHNKILIITNKINRNIKECKQRDSVKKGKKYKQIVRNQFLDRV